MFVHNNLGMKQCYQLSNIRGHTALDAIAITPLITTTPDHCIPIYIYLQRCNQHLHHTVPRVQKNTDAFMQYDYISSNSHTRFGNNVKKMDWCL